MSDYPDHWGPGDKFIEARLEPVEDGFTSRACMAE